MTNLAVRLGRLEALADRDGDDDGNPFVFCGGDSCECSEDGEHFTIRIDRRADDDEGASDD